MKKGNSQSELSGVLKYGAPLVSILVLTGAVSDPVNAPKLTVLGGVALASIFIIVGSLEFKSFRKFPKASYVAPIFILWSAIASLKSASPFSQNFYGVYGRNSGFLTYFFLVVIFFSASLIKDTYGISKVFSGFLFAAAINIVYSAWVIFFGDFIGWENPYGAILGTFGNPNFVSSFLGMSVGPILAAAIYGSKQNRIVAFLLLPLVGLEIAKADSLQGVVVACIAVGLVSTYWLRYRFSSVRMGAMALGSGLAVGILAFMGALGKGPMTGAMAQPTVALREQYWYAAIQMSKQNPIFGVGMDAYGDWYRRARGAKALISPGAETVTNVAHNVFLDILSFGGVPLLLAYLAINFFGLRIIFKRFFSANNLDINFLNISVVWICFQIQSIISINQIGLAIWGWLLTGLLIAWHHIEGNPSADVPKKVLPEVKQPQLLPLGLIGSFGACIGIFLAVPPLSADMRWMNALKAQSLPLLEQALDNSYFSPNNSVRLAQAVQTLGNSNLSDLSLKYARRGVEFNPESTQAWLTLYYVKAATVEEKSRAKNRLIKLDPLNPKWRDLD